MDVACAVLVGVLGITRELALFYIPKESRGGRREWMGIEFAPLAVVLGTIFVHAPQSIQPPLKIVSGD